jgi:hypothetical protein
MNHRVTLAIVAIVAATALTAIPFAVPQQALAGGHHYKHNNDSSNIRVDQQVNQANFCNGTSPTPQPMQGRAAAAQHSSSSSSSSSTTCINVGDNQADISK